MHEKRIALVIGNNKYSANWTLDSPTLDAAAMKKGLAQLGFKVIARTNCSTAAMRQVINTFKLEINRNPGCVALFFFSGHGASIKGENCCAPIDFDDDCSSGTFRIIYLQDIIDAMSENSRIRIILMDACRVADSMIPQEAGKTIEIIDGFKSKAIYVGSCDKPSGGLAEMEAATDTFIAFAAAPGAVAFQGQHESIPSRKPIRSRIGLSPFTRAFF